MNYMLTYNLVAFYLMNDYFLHITRKWILPNVIRAVPTVIILGKIHFLVRECSEFLVRGGGQFTLLLGTVHNFS